MLRTSRPSGGQLTHDVLRGWPPVGTNRVTNRPDEVSETSRLFYLPPVLAAKKPPLPAILSGKSPKKSLFAHMVRLNRYLAHGRLRLSTSHQAVGVQFHLELGMFRASKRPAGSTYIRIVLGVLCLSGTLSKRSRARNPSPSCSFRLVI